MQRAHVPELGWPQMPAMKSGLYLVGSSGDGMVIIKEFDNLIQILERSVFHWFSK